jgi:uncharacterized protein (DUF2345 family)
VYAADHQTFTPASAAAVAMPKLPFYPENTPSTYSQTVNALALVGVDPDTHKPYANLAYEAYGEDGQMLAKGVLNDQGETSAIYTDKPEKVRVFIGDGTWAKHSDSKGA